MNHAMSHAHCAINLLMSGSPPYPPHMPLHASPCRRLAQEWHPDKCKPERKALAEVKFKEIKDAYDQILKGKWLQLCLVTALTVA